MKYTESSKKSATWVGENIEQIKLQNNSDPIRELIERRKRKGKKIQFSVAREYYTVDEVQS